MQNKLMEAVEKTTLKASTPAFEIGDTVDVHVRILEGDKERIQIYNGVVIARSGQGPRDVHGAANRARRGCGAEVSAPIAANRRHRGQAAPARCGGPSSTICGGAPARRSASKSGSPAQQLDRGQGSQGRAPKGASRQERAGQELTWNESPSGSAGAILVQLTTALGGPFVRAWPRHHRRPESGRWRIGISHDRETWPCHFKKA